MAGWHELIIKGGDKEVLAYLKGFFAGRGITHGFYFGEDEAFHLRHMREFIKYRSDVAHLICDTALRSTVASAIRKASKEFDFEIKESRKVKAASFGFDFKTANRQVAGSLKRALTRLPADVHMEGFEPVEIVDPSAKGVEGYAPLHEYEFRGKGVVSGDVAGVLKVHARLSENRAFRVEEIDIHT